MSKIANQRGFTIIELLVIIVVIGVLAVISLVSYSGISNKAIIASLQSDLKAASTQLKVFQTNNDNYPTAINCANPANTEICIRPSQDNVFEGYAYNNSTSQKSFSLRARNTRTNIIYIITDNTPPVAYVASPPVTFAYTGNYQTYVVPAGVSNLSIEAWGAQGGAGGGNGGYAKGTISVTSGETLRVYVGGQGVFNDYCNKAANQGAGWNGGGGSNCYGAGGGGASDVRKSPYSLNDRIIVGAGGGGAGISDGIGGGGGGLIGQAGSGGPVTGGGGGTQSGGGTVANGSNGSFGQGGYPTTYNYWGGSGGGGGGWYGGAAGNSPIGGAGGGGGGGSSYVISSANNVSYQTGIRSGNGQVIITPQ